MPCPARAFDHRAPASHQPYTPRVTGNMLIVTQVAPYVDGPAGVHGTLAQATTGLSELADLAGLSPVHVPDVRDVSPDVLAASRVLALFTIGETPWSDEQKAAVHAAWRDGNLRILGVHSATDASHTWPEYGVMLGARFDGHPWTQPFAIDVVDDAHPATAHLGEQWDWTDEVYLFRDLRPDARRAPPPARRRGGPLGAGRPGARVRLPPGLVRRGRPGAQLLHRPGPLPAGVGAARLPAPPGRRTRLAGGQRVA